MRSRQYQFTNNEVKMVDNIFLFLYRYEVKAVTVYQQPGKKGAGHYKAKFFIGGSWWDYNPVRHGQRKARWEEEFVKVEKGETIESVVYGKCS